MPTSNNQRYRAAAIGAGPGGSPRVSKMGAISSSALRTSLPTLDGKQLIGTHKKADSMVLTSGNGR